MNADCKNCKTSISAENSYCGQCGAKVVSGRITVKNLVADVSQNIFGWDNKFFFTIKMLITRPGILLREYFDGTRKKYVNPFAFLAIGMGINLFVFNSFDTDFYRVMDDFNSTQIEWYGTTFGGPFATAEFQEQQLEQSAKTTRNTLKYFNFLVILLMPFYTFLAFFVYRKPFNYGEHLIVNSYIQGFSFLTTTLVFFISIVIHPAFYLLIYPLLILYYTYVYGKLYKLSFWQSVLKIIVFLAFLFALSMAVIIFIGLVSFAFGYLTAK